MKLSKSKSLHKPKNKRKRFGKNKSYRIIKLKNKKKNSFKKNKYLNLKNKSFRKKRKHKQKGGKTDGDGQASSVSNNDVLQEIQSMLNETNETFSKVARISEYLYEDGDENKELGFVYITSINKDMYAVLFNSEFHNNIIEPIIKNPDRLKQEIKNNPQDLFLYRGNTNTGPYNLGSLDLDNQNDITPIQGHSQSRGSEIKTLKESNIHPNIFILMKNLDSYINTYITLNEDWSNKNAFKKIVNVPKTNEISSYQVKLENEVNPLKLELDDVIPHKEGQQFVDIFKMTSFYYSYILEKDRNFNNNYGGPFIDKFKKDEDEEEENAYDDDDNIDLNKLFKNIPLLVSHQNNNHYPFPFNDNTKVRYQKPYQMKMEKKDDGFLGKYTDKPFNFKYDLFPIIENASHIINSSDNESQTIDEGAGEYSKIETPNAQPTKENLEIERKLEEKLDKLMEQFKLTKVEIEKATQTAAEKAAQDAAKKVIQASQTTQTIEALPTTDDGTEDDGPVSDENKSKLENITKTALLAKNLRKKEDDKITKDNLKEKLDRFFKYKFTENSDEIETGTSITVYSSGNSDGNLTIHVSNKTKALEQLEKYKDALKKQKAERERLRKIKEETEGVENDNKDLKKDIDAAKRKGEKKDTAGKEGNVTKDTADAEQEEKGPKEGSEITTVDENKFELIEVEGDGNCFYSSIAELIMNEQDEDKKRYLGELNIEGALNKKKIMEAVRNKLNKNPEDWANETDIKNAIDIFEKQINILTIKTENENDKDIKYVWHNSFNPYTADKDKFNVSKHWNILHHKYKNSKSGDGNHYDALICRKCNETRPEPINKEAVFGEIDMEKMDKNNTKKDTATDAAGTDATGDDKKAATAATNAAGAAAEKAAAEADATGDDKKGAATDAADDAGSVKAAAEEKTKKLETQLKKDQLIIQKNMDRIRKKNEAKLQQRLKRRKSEVITKKEKRDHTEDKIKERREKKQKN